MPWMATRHGLVDNLGAYQESPTAIKTNDFHRSGGRSVKNYDPLAKGQHVASLSGQRADEAGGRPAGQAAPGPWEDQVPARCSLAPSPGSHSVRSEGCTFPRALWGPSLHSTLQPPPQPPGPTRGSQITLCRIFLKGLLDAKHQKEQLCLLPITSYMLIWVLSRNDARSVCKFRSVRGSILPGPSFQSPYHASKRKGTKLGS